MWIERLKKKWNITSNLDFILIMLVFSLAGMGISFTRKPIFHLLGIGAQTPLWVKVAVYIPLIVPMYQLYLMIFGIIFGQFAFFWEKEKKLGRFLWAGIKKTKIPYLAGFLLSWFKDI